MNFSSKLEVVLLLLLGFTFGLGALSQKVSHGGGLASGQPGMNIYSDKPPGETKKLDRPYIGAPPLVPHSVVELNVSRSANDCLDCHLEGVEIEEGHVATKVPPSHYLNEYRGEKEKDQVTGVRYNCLQCHLPQTREESQSRP